MGRWEDRDKDQIKIPDSSPPLLLSPPPSYTLAGGGWLDRGEESRHPTRTPTAKRSLAFETEEVPGCC
jgi:hypothetical protein